MTTWHIVDGEEGCAFAARRGLATVIVDALRASATAAMLFEHGARQITVVREVEEALELRQADPEALLFGERGGLPPPGFDAGNSPRETDIAWGRRVIFTTTNGARCLVAARGVSLLLFGTTTNATAVARHLLACAADVVLVCAGAPGEFATEDRAAAVCIAKAAGVAIGEGADIVATFENYLAPDAMLDVFQRAKHAATMRALGLDDDITFCARQDVTEALPQVHHFEGAHAVLRDARFA